MNEYKHYSREQVNSDNAQNIVLELAARAMAHGNRIIIEQNPERGKKYIMVDFNPTDGSMKDEWVSSFYVMAITSVDEDSETGEGEFFDEFRNYVDGINEVCRILRQNEWSEMYTESY